MAVLFRNLSGADRAKIISNLRDKGFLPNDALKDIVVARDRDEFKKAVKNASQEVGKGELKNFFDALQGMLNRASIEGFLSGDCDLDEFIESYF